MAHLDVINLYQCQFTPEEFRLVCLALAGKLRPQEMLEALDLNVRLSEMRAKQVALSNEKCGQALKQALSLRDAPEAKGNGGQS